MRIILGFILTFISVLVNTAVHAAPQETISENVRSYVYPDGEYMLGVDGQSCVSKRTEVDPYQTVCVSRNGYCQSVKLSQIDQALGFAWGADDSAAACDDLCKPINCVNNGDSGKERCCDTLADVARMNSNDTFRCAPAVPTCRGPKVPPGIFGADGNPLPCCAGLLTNSTNGFCFPPPVQTGGYVPPAPQGPLIFLPLPGPSSPGSCSPNCAAGCGFPDGCGGTCTCARGTCSVNGQCVQSGGGNNSGGSGSGGNSGGGNGGRRACQVGGQCVLLVNPERCVQCAY